MASDTTRQKAIECIADAMRVVDGKAPWPHDIVDALKAADFEILGPGNRKQVGWYCAAHGLTASNCTTYQGDERECQRRPVYVRTDGGDAS